MGERKKADKPSDDLRKKIMDDGEWFPSTKRMKRALGRNTADILMHHLDYQVIHSPGYNNRIRDDITDTMGIGRKRQKFCEDTLVYLGLLSIKKVGKVNRYSYTVHLEKVEELQVSLVEGGIELIREFRENLDNHSNNSQENGGAGQAKNAPPCGSAGQALFALLTQNSKETVYKYTVLENEFSGTHGEENIARNKPAETVAVKKSRLVDKGEIKTSLADRTNNSAGGVKRIDRKALKCIEYWNSHPELMSHQINLDKPSSTITLASRLLRAMFNGKFLDLINTPYGFEDHKWFDRNVTVDEFCDIVDDFLACIRNPDVKPVSNGTRFNLITFLKGNHFANQKEGGTPSQMMTYCFGDYKTVVRNKFPKTVEQIKAYWLKLIGKFTDTPSSERAFVIVSNLCNQRYAEKRAENKSWTPAQNDYRPAGIARQILIDKADWFKKERKSPEIMGGSFFSDIIRRYDYDKKTGSMVL